MQPKSSTLAARSMRSVWDPCTQLSLHQTRLPVAIERAHGPWLHGEDGNRYLDGISSWWVNLFGHGHPHIKAALAEQFDRLDHVMLAGFTHAPVVELSEKLAALTGLGHAFYSSDGASATASALKMSANYWRSVGNAAKCRFVALAGGYHGETVGALGVNAMAMFCDAYAPLVRLGAIVPSPDARQTLPQETSGGVACRAAMQLGTWLVRHHDTTAALIVEPLVQCAAGMAMYHPEYLRQARVLCDQYQVHLIADESATGFGRTGTMFAHEQAGIRPDFICLSRALTGGTLPLSAVLTNDAVYEAFYDDEAPWAFLHSDSYTANPLACRAALATLELFEREDTLRRNSELAQALDEAFVCVSTHPRVRNSRRLGMIWAWDISDAPAGFSRTFALRALSHGVLLRPIGNTVYAMPPYVLNRGELQHLAEATHAALVDTLEGTRA